MEKIFLVFVFVLMGNQSFAWTKYVCENGSLSKCVMGCTSGTWKCTYAGPCNGKDSGNCGNGHLRVEEIDSNTVEILVDDGERSTCK